jgi:hypothetical protein
MKPGETVYTKNSLDKVIECKFVSQTGDILFLMNQEKVEISRHILSTAKTEGLAENI